MLMFLVFFSLVFALLLITKHCVPVDAYANDVRRRRCRCVAEYEEALHYAKQIKNKQNVKDEL